MSEFTDNLKKPSRATIIALFIVVVSLLLRLKLALLPLMDSVGMFLADDAFYYLQIADNIVTGHGVTFDGQIVTNGFHPLFMLVCIIAQALFTRMASIYVILIFLAIVGAFNTWMLYRLGREASGEICGIAAAWFWVIHPFPRMIELMGVEAPMAVAFLLLATYRWMKIRDGEDTRRSWLLLGLLVGLAFLSRTDTIFFAFPLALHVLIFYRRNLREAAPRFLAAGGVSLAVVAPWLLWNLATFGRITQDSGRTLIYTAHAAANQLGAGFFSELAFNARDTLRDGLLKFVSFFNPLWSLIFVIAVLVVGIILAVESRKSGKPGLWSRASVFLVAGALSWLFYNFVFLHRKNWYFLLPLAVCALLIGRVVEMVATRFGNSRNGVAAFLLLLLMLPWSIGSTQLQSGGFHPWQRNYLILATAIRDGQVEEIDKDAVIGSFNAGIYGYFSGHRVINLDGVVNPNIYDVYKSRALIQYIREAGIDFLLDHKVMFSYYAAPFASESPVDTFVLVRSFPGGKSAGEILLLTWKKPKAL